MDLDRALPHEGDGRGHRHLPGPAGRPGAAGAVRRGGEFRGGAYWFDEAKKAAEATQEEWLFLTGIMQTDGWVQRAGSDSNGNRFTAWTKAKE